MDLGESDSRIGTCSESNCDSRCNNKNKKFKDPDVIFLAIDKGDLRHIRSLYKQGYPLTKYCYYLASANENCAVLEWLMKIKPLDDPYIWVFNVLEFKLKHMKILNCNPNHSIRYTYFLEALSNVLKLPQKVNFVLNDFENYSAFIAKPVFDLLQRYEIKLVIDFVGKYALIRNDLDAILWLQNNTHKLKYTRMLDLSGNFAGVDCLEFILNHAQKYPSCEEE
jgi:hypothetical protein